VRYGQESSRENYGAIGSNDVGCQILDMSLQKVTLQKVTPYKPDELNQDSNTGLVSPWRGSSGHGFTGALALDR
jgi:hypothetical protein